MKKAKPRRLPRRHLKSNRLPSWCIFIQIAGRGKNGNGKIAIDHKIYFCALDGGNAKVKALPKLQSFLGQISWEFSGSPKVNIFLKKILNNGNSNGGVMAYKGKERMSYMNALLREKQPSKVFVATG